MIVVQLYDSGLGCSLLKYIHCDTDKFSEVASLNNSF